MVLRNREPPRSQRLFQAGIGQITSALASSNGQTVTYLPPWTCTMIPEPRVFWPLGSNAIPPQGMISLSAGGVVSASAFRIASGWVAPARLIASARVLRPVSDGADFPV